MQISILLSTFRRPRQLGEALASLAQHDRSLIGEILVGDDSPLAFRADNQAAIAASEVAGLVRYVVNDPPRGRFPNQFALARAARFDHILILHGDHQLCPGSLALLAGACLAETDDSVKIWFGRNLILDENGQVDPVRTAANSKDYGRDGPPAVRPVREWCFTNPIPPDGFLVRRAAYVAHMSGPRDGQAADWGMAVRLGNSGASGHFIAQDVTRYRVSGQASARPKRIADIHRTYELTQQWEVPAAHIGIKKKALRLVAEVATTRYLLDGERRLAWQCFVSPDWRWKRRFSPRGIATLGMLLTPSVCWHWALRQRD